MVNVDALTYAACLESVASIAKHPNYAFEQVDIRDRAGLDAVFSRHSPDAVMHLAAETHVDRSIDGPADFIETNVNGTLNMLEAARSYWQAKAQPRHLGFTTSVPMRYLEACRAIQLFFLQKIRPMIRAARILHLRRVLIIWSARGMRPMACR